MFGAIIGDIVGSVYEWHNIKTKEFPLFLDDCFFTDDTVMTIASADAIMSGATSEDFIDAYKKWGRLYPNAGYGSRFGGWLFSDDRAPYNSWGNGSAMRVSPCGWAYPMTQSVHEGIDKVNKLAEISASVTHSHPEGIKGAKAVALSIYLLRSGRAYGIPGSNRERIKDYLDYDLSATLDKIRPGYQFNESCQDTVPQAIIAFLESDSFEDAIRNAISLGGDSDTLTAITGSLAEAAYGIPEWIKVKAWSYLDEPLKEVCRRWRGFVASQSK